MHILRQVCGSLAEAHAQGFVHRDIKPSNIILPAPGDPNDVVKLVDFGIARFTEGDGTDLTGSFFVGTTEYIAPEVLQGEKADAASDIYSLGVTAYEALTGSLPLRGENRAALMLKLLTTEPDPPSRVAPHLPPTVDEVLASRAARDTGRDANNLISQARTWQRHNVGDTPGFGGDHEKALGAIATRVLSMPCETDLYFPIGDFRYEAQFIKGVTFTPIPSLWGHSAGSGGNPVDNSFIDERVAAFLNHSTR